MRRALAVLAVASLALAACSSSDSSEGGGVPGDTTTTSAATGTSDVERPDGPVADISEELTKGKPFLADVVNGIDMPAGWTETEYVAAGTAHRYTADGDLPADGNYDLTESTEDPADYRTRVAVRMPPTDEFNGTVVVEWLNVSSGLDANPDFIMGYEELYRGGYAWVGVSAQKIGVEGGDVAVKVDAAGEFAGKGLKGIDPERYGSLEHPGDAYSYDMYTQVGRAVREKLAAERVLAIGESQSAFALTTYANGVQPLTQAFDGFLVHSRGAAGLGLGEPGEAMDIAGAIGQQVTTIRTDLDVPTLIVESETDLFSVISYYPARQDDTDKIRLWEIAGTAHADERVLGPVGADAVDCGVPVNSGPQHFVIKAAFRALDTWVRSGKAPPEAERLTDTAVDGKPAAKRNADGIALGGIRTPQVDVPSEVLSGDPGPSSEIICLLLGSTKPLSSDRLAELYPSRTDYLGSYQQATDAAIESGFVLEDDRQAMLDDANPDLIAG